MSTSGVTVAIDGPSAAGKSTVAKAVARELGYTLVDTGAIYRAVALLAKRAGVAFDDDARLRAIVDALDISFEMRGDSNRVRVGNEDVSDAIRAPEISMAASTVSAQPSVRAGLLALQRRLAGKGGAVLEGRDIGTVVCPDAQVKFFLDASVDERSRRRFEEERRRGVGTNLESVRDSVVTRDHQDATRAHAPLRAAEDAVRLDSTGLTPEEVVKKVIEAVRAAEQRAGVRRYR